MSSSCHSCTLLQSWPTFAHLGEHQISTQSWAHHCTVHKPVDEWHRLFFWASIEAFFFLNNIQVFNSMLTFYLKHCAYIFCSVFCKLFLTAPFNKKKKNKITLSSELHLRFQLNFHNQLSYLSLCHWLLSILLNLNVTVTSLEWVCPALVCTQELSICKVNEGEQNLSSPSKACTWCWAEVKASACLSAEMWCLNCEMQIYLRTKQTDIICSYLSPSCLNFVLLLESDFCLQMCG